MKNYEVNHDLVKELKNSQYKKHPKWQEKAKVRTRLRIFRILTAIVMGGICAFEMNNNMLLDFIVGLFAFYMICAIPGIIYYKSLKNTCNDFLDNKLNESLILTDNSIKNTYNSRQANDNRAYQCDELPYVNIQKIVHNTYHKRIDLYGKRTKTYYTNYELNEKGATRGIKGKDAKLRLYLYYYENERLLKTLEEKCKVEFEIINCSEQ